MQPCAAATPHAPPRVPQRRCVSLRAPAACARLLRRAAPRRLRGAHATTAAPLAPLALASLPASAPHLLVCGDLSTALFALGQQADALVNANLAEVTPATYAVVLVRC